MVWGWNSIQHTQVLAALSGPRHGGQSEYLTMNGLIIAMITTTLSFLADLLPGITFLRQAKRFFFMIAFTLSGVVTAIYWPMVLTAPSLINPAYNPNPPATPLASNNPIPLTGIPLPVDLALHFAPGAYFFLDFFLFERRYTSVEIKRTGRVLTLIAAAAYTGWVEYCAQYNQTFPYPFLNVPFLSRLAIYSTATLFGYGFFAGVNALHS